MSEIQEKPSLKKDIYSLTMISRDSAYRGNVQAILHCQFWRMYRESEKFIHWLHMKGIKRRKADNVVALIRLDLEGR